MVLSTYIDHRCIFSSSIGSRVVAPFKWIMIKQKREQEPDRVVVRIDRKPRPNWETDGGSFAFDQLGLFFYLRRRVAKLGWFGAASVTRLGEILPLWLNFTSLAIFWRCISDLAKCWTNFVKFVILLGWFSLLQTAKCWKLIQPSGRTVRLQTKPGANSSNFLDSYNLLPPQKV